jgi:hypothetical protein
MSGKPSTEEPSAAEVNALAKTLRGLIYPDLAQDPKAAFAEYEQAREEREGLI